ncbi:MAG: type II toxin-antitoxin system prevent-host-death family antitoxin [Acidobacteria bacterium]|nr:type II toxin-antitoxin system prevent-host-death family antitoxin [Acidobacteriota bacterium]
MVRFRIEYQVMLKVNIADAKARLSMYVESVERGETVVLCRRNVPVAEIRPIATLPRQERPVGIDRGMRVPDSFFEPLPDEILHGMTLVTPDPKIARYPAPVLW